MSRHWVVSCESTVLTSSENPFQSSAVTMNDARVLRGRAINDGMIFNRDTGGWASRAGCRCSLEIGPQAC